MKIRPCSDNKGTTWFDEFDEVVHLTILGERKNFRALLNGRLLTVTFESIDDEGEEVWIAKAMDADTLEWVVIENQLLELVSNEHTVKEAVIGDIRRQVAQLRPYIKRSTGLHNNAISYVRLNSVYEILNDLLNRNKSTD